jgi:spore germination protein YaaH
MTIQEQSEFTELQRRVDELTTKVIAKDAELDQARGLAEKHRDMNLVQYEDTAMYNHMYREYLLPWE